jgi:superfamily II DNA or RNA helicase
MLRPYQKRMIEAIRPNTLITAPTGAGKSHCIARWAEQWGFCGMLILAHNEEILRQISNKLPMPHDIIAPRQPWRGHSVAVASVATLARRPIDLSRYNFAQFDEAHHVVEGNQWGAVRRRLAHAYVIGWSATPFRLDKRSLSWAFPGGLVQGPSTRQLVEGGYITPIQAYGPPCPIDRETLRRSASGDYSLTAMTRSLRRSSMVSDVAASYLRFAPGKRGITFAASVEMARDHARAYNEIGVPAAVLTGESRDRGECIEKLARKELLQLVVVGLFGEGFDLPGIEVATLARLSESAALVWQQIGRVRRPAPGKRMGIVIDHGGNILRHGLPDFIDHWELDENARSAQAGSAALRTCPYCLKILFDNRNMICPFCGAILKTETHTKRAETSQPLEAYSDAQIAALTAEARRITRVPERAARTAKERIIFKRMRDRAEQQNELRMLMEQWTNKHGVENFQKNFGIHPLKAKTLGGKDLKNLKAVLSENVE